MRLPGPHPYLRLLRLARELATGGNPGKRKLPKSEPKPQAGAPGCPTWLDTEAKAEWRRLVPEGALAACCVAWSEIHAASKLLAKEGRTFSTDKGYVVQHPAVGMQRSALTIYRSYLALFGLDPSSRSKLSVPGRDPEEDAFEAFVRGSG